MAAFQSGPLSLPNELSHTIINLTRPLDFENVMLVCKHIYAVGKDLIADHNFCKSWLTNCTKGTPGKDPLGLLDRLLSAPVQTQTWLLPYIRTFHYYHGPWSNSSPEYATILDRIERDAPWLAKELLHLSDTFPATKRYQEKDDFEHYVALLDAHESHSMPWTDIRREPNPTFYDMSTLLLLSNVRQLALGSMPRLDRQINLPWLIKSQRGQQYFQQLQELKLQSTTRTSLADVSSWLLLPSLKALIVDGLPTENDLLDAYSQIPFDLSFGVHASTIEHLVFLKATAKVEALGEILEPLKSLHTFVWEDDMNYKFPSDSIETSNSEDDDTLSKDGKHVVETTTEDWLESPHVSDSDDTTEEEDTEELRPLIPDGINEALLFKPNKLLAYLSRNMASTLEHLVLTVNHHYRRPLVLKQYQIEDFKAFHSLTHLEIDAQIVKTKRGKARCLTHILPTSIKVVCITMVIARFEHLYRILYKLSTNTSEFPSLHKIIIRFAEYDSTCEVLTKMHRLKDKLQEVGVFLEMHKCGTNQMTASGPVTLDEEAGAGGFNNRSFIQPKTMKLTEVPYVGPLGFEESMARRVV